MARPIKFTREIFNSLQDQIFKLFNQASAKGEFTVKPTEFKLDYKYKIEFTTKAYIKMLLVTLSRDTEIGWSGVVERVDDTYFIIKDILIPPQRVTGTTYRTDDDKYGEWLLSLSDEEYNNLRFNGHSHVEMSTSPSGMDMDVQQDTVSQLKEDDYYIFIIFNKKQEVNLWVYDLKNNISVTNEEITVSIPEETIELIKIIKEAHNKCTKTTVYQSKSQPLTTTSSLKSNIKKELTDYDEDEDDVWDEEDYYRQMEKYYGSGYMGLM